MVIPASEGSQSILYGPVALPIGSGEYGAYLARPDRPGTYPSVVVLPGLAGISPVEKAFARHMAKHGRVALVPDPYRGRGPGRGVSFEEAAAAYAALSDARLLADVAEVRAYLASPATDWADASPSALVGFDVGGRLAMLAATRRSDVATVVALGAPLGGDDERVAVGDALPSVGASVLALYGGEDRHVSRADIDAAQEAAPHARFIVYEGTGHAFYDPSSPDYHPGAEADALARIRAWLDAALPIPA